MKAQMTGRDNPNGTPVGGLTVLRLKRLPKQRGLKRDTIPSGLDENVTLTQGSSVTRNPGLEVAIPLGLSFGQVMAPGVLASPHLLISMFWRVMETLRGGERARTLNF